MFKKILMLVLLVLTFGLVSCQNNSSFGIVENDFSIIQDYYEVNELEYDEVDYSLTTSFEEDSYLAFYEINFSFYSIYDYSQSIYYYYSYFGENQIIAQMDNAETGYGNFHSKTYFLQVRQVEDYYIYAFDGTLIGSFPYDNTDNLDLHTLNNQKLAFVDLSFYEVLHGEDVVGCIVFDDKQKTYEIIDASEIGEFDKYQYISDYYGVEINSRISKNYYPLFDEVDNQYYYITLEDSIVVYNKDDEYVNAFPEFYLPENSNYGETTFQSNIYVDGTIIMQTLEALNDDEAEYDVIIEGVKYNYTTIIYNIITGKTEEIEVDYLIIDYYYDDNLTDEYAEVELYLIENKTISAGGYGIINNDGETAVSAYFDDNVSYYDGYYYCYSEGAILDEDLNLICNNADYLSPKYGLYFVEFNDNLECYQIGNDETVFSEDFEIIYSYTDSMVLKNADDEYYVFDYATKELEYFINQDSILKSNGVCIITIDSENQELLFYEMSTGDLLDSIEIEENQATYLLSSPNSNIDYSFGYDFLDLSVSCIIKIDLGSSTLIYKYFSAGQVLD